MPEPAILIHAGAGSFRSELFDDAAISAAALHEALGVAGAMLEGGANATAAVIAAVELLESFELFNAGAGSALCSDGSVQMSAGLMRGSDRAAGGVAGLRTVEHPIAAAHAVLCSHEVLLIGGHADAFAREQGLAQQPNAFFVTERQSRRLAERTGGDRGTVGAVCLDARGRLAAGTSTGGITGQPPGRVGDTPVIGAGTWADDRVAISCTGEGEAFIRSGAARLIAGLVAGGMALAEACRRALADVEALGGGGGLIALDAAGGQTLPFTTEAMPRGVWRRGAEPQVWVAEPPATE